MPSDPSVASRPAIPRAVWVLGLVSLFMDLSSEAVHALLPVYLVVGMGAGTVVVGVIEGMAEAIASITKLFSGALSDRLGRRKLLAVLGYGLAAATKPVFPLAPSIEWIAGARFADRVGKGIRGAPRDALVADLSPPEIRGASFGLRQSLDTVGALLGPGLALVMMAVTHGSYHAAFWAAALPAVLAVLLLVVGVHEPGRSTGHARPPAGMFRLYDLAQLGSGFWFVLIIGELFALARFSEAFLLLRGQSLGLSPSIIPAVMIVMNLVYAASAWPAGAASDRRGRAYVLQIGLSLLVLADLALAFAGSYAWLAVGVALWGLHMGYSQGVLSAMVADEVPQHLRGTAFGVFNFALGLGALGASVIAGVLWQVDGPRATFLLGAVLATLALLGLVAYVRTARAEIRP